MSKKKSFINLILLIHFSLFLLIKSNYLDAETSFSNGKLHHEIKNGANEYIIFSFIDNQKGITSDNI